MAVSNACNRTIQEGERWLETSEVLRQVEVVRQSHSIDLDNRAAFSTSAPASVNSAG
jgi:hypothetical protein